MKRVFIIHGWEGYPEEGWFPWLKKELEAKGFQVIVPFMPSAAKPRIHTWVPALADVVGIANEETYFVGHSMGCQAIARYIETLPEGRKVGGAIFVGGFFKRLMGLEDNPAVMETDKHWLEAPLDLDKVGRSIKKSVAVFSTDDPWVPLDNKDDFKNKLNSEIVIVDGMKHFSGDDGIKKLPIVLQKLLEIAK